MVNTPSPLRYPGGKVILYDRIKRIIIDNELIGCTYIEPFSGGAGLALKLLINGDVEKIIINDIDYAVYSFWHNVLYENERFCLDIKNINVDINEWKKQKKIYELQSDFSMYEVGFATFFLNRTNRSGIIKGGPIGGKLQQGRYKIDCRFNKDNLIDKIKLIGNYKKNIRLFNYDVNDFIKKVINKQKKKKLFIYFDPPYINKGPGLYENHFHIEDHRKLSNNIKANLKPEDWIITYDDNKLVYELYDGLNIEKFKLNYYAGEKKVGNELMIKSSSLANKKGIKRKSTK